MFAVALTLLLHSTGTAWIFDYVVYEQAIQNRVGNHQFVLQRETTSGHCEVLGLHRPRVESSTLFSFGQRNANTPMVDDLVPSVGSRKRRVVAQKVIEATLGPLHDWDQLHRKFGVTRRVKVSAVGWSSDQRQAFLYFESEGPSERAGECLLYELRGTRPVLIDSTMAWKR